jgi:hypothetical protein
MGKDKVVFIAVVFDKFIAKPSYSGSGINDDNIVTRCSDLNTGRITAVFDIIRS